MTELRSIDALVTEIAELERQLRARKSALKELRKLGAAPVDKARAPYFEKSPKDAARLLLSSVGAPMDRDALQSALVAGGITIGKKRAESNVRIGIDKNIENGNLILIDDLIGLPEWVEDETFKGAPQWRKMQTAAHR